MERWIPDATTVSAWFDDNRSTHPWQRACELHSIANASAQEVTASGFERVCFIRTARWSERTTQPPCECRKMRDTNARGRSDGLCYSAERPSTIFCTLP